MQREELLHGFDLFLIEKWAHEIPSSDPDLFRKQKIRGEFAFNLARLENSTSPASSQHSTLLLLYFLWNGALTIVLNTRDNFNIAGMSEEKERGPKNNRNKA